MKFRTLRVAVNPFWLKERLSEQTDGVLTKRPQGMLDAGKISHMEIRYFIRGWGVFMEAFADLVELPALR